MPTINEPHKVGILIDPKVKKNGAPLASNSPLRSSNKAIPPPPVTAPRTHSQELNNTAKVVSPDGEEANNEQNNSKLTRATSPMYSPLRPPTEGKHSIHIFTYPLAIHHIFASHCMILRRMAKKAIVMTSFPMMSCILVPFLALFLFKIKFSKERDTIHISIHCFQNSLFPHE